MAILTKQQDQTGGHWYTADGQPCHWVPKKSGDGERKVNISDARLRKLIPSVTTILSAMSKEALMTWRIKEALKFADANKRQPEEPVDFWVKRIMATADEQVSEAANLGSKVHDALDKAMGGEEYDPELAAYVQPVVDWLRGLGVDVVAREQVVVNLPQGYAGTMDVAFRYGNKGVGVLDYKTRRTVPGKKVDPYDGQAMQLAAYSAAFWGEGFMQSSLCANVYISTTEPGRVEIVKHTDPQRHYDAFLATCALWRYLKDYDPRMEA